MAVEVGDEAPEFELRDDEFQSVRLSDFRGKKNVLLVFYPLAFSLGCEKEFCTLRDENADIATTDDLEVLGVSVDSVWSLRAWKQRERFPNRFLSDFWPHGEVCRAYGAFDERYGTAQRHTFLIDREGIVRYVERNSAKDLRDQAAWRDALTAVS